MTTPGQHPDASGQCPDAGGGHIRITSAVDRTTDRDPLPTRTDAIRTRPDTDPADASGGFRFAYRARVPRHLMGAAFAEALDLIARETRTPLEEQTDDT
ncbi:hypothetical protein [Streptomyces sp. NE06-03C]|uniref:hypothetical protein n=1 Tax=Streptomyces sp. NE06-03C TaxID=3028694 RepID=UPI0029B31075|nr:hypothetical protein [Streptomyces sp. NE06-03C]MDX2922725.1 hypothetical protein [Streptomyces sp. NE06-03C]